MMDRVRGHTQRRARWEAIATDLDGLRVGILRAGAGHQARQAEGAGAVDAQGLIDDVLQVGEVLDGLVAGHAGGDAGVELLLQLGQHAGGAEDPVQQGAGGVGGGVGAGDQLREGLGGQLAAAEGLAVGVLALHEAGEEVDAVGVGVVEALAHARDGDAGEVLDRLDALAEEGVGQVFGVGLQLRQTAERAGDFAAPVEHLDRRRERGGGVGRLADLGDVAAVLEHAEGGAEGQVTDDVEGEVVEPVEGVDGGIAGLGVLLRLGELGPFAHEHVEVAVDVLLELADGFGAEGVRDDLALARVFGAVACVEEAALDADEGVVIFTVECKTVVGERMGDAYAFRKPFPWP